MSCDESSASPLYFALFDPLLGVIHFKGQVYAVDVSICVHHSLASSLEPGESRFQLPWGVLMHFILRRTFLACILLFALSVGAGFSHAEARRVARNQRADPYHEAGNQILL